jgi:phenylpyruvate tautomerase PptA (4-oxalocrotonate tautomerase family)
MPVITVKMAKGRTSEQKQQFVEAIWGLEREAQNNY